MMTKNRLGIKGATMKLFGRFSNNQEISAGNHLILVTAIGIITGTYQEPMDDVYKDNEIRPDSIAQVIKQQISDAVDDIDTEFLFDETTSIILTDVSINNNGFITNMPSLLVFADQVIGVTIGKLEKN